MRANRERRREDGHVVSTGRARIDVNLVHRWTAGEYRAPDGALIGFVAAPEAIFLLRGPAR